MTIESASQKLVAEFSSRRTLRTGSLITTVFGDSIAPRGGTVWLGSLITAMAAFGVSERLVRTSVFRLVQDDWLQATQIGRRSYYSLTDEGRGRFEQATNKIYGQPATGWDHNWCLVLLAGLDAESRDAVKKELGWLGFGILSGNVLAHPAPDHADLETALGRLGLAGDVPILSAQTMRNTEAMRELAQTAWNLEDIDVRYASFVKRFRPLIAAYGKHTAVKPQTAFLVRTLLIQEYRKVLLRDPQLPAELLPAGWHGTAAYQLCRNLYLAVYREADDYLSATMETADGPLPPPSGAFMKRFGGLDR
ncbi:phenylacetic acid degradation operon negative regulatory protein PaaX [Gammaproteobacteria bacterium]|jgi:phenylacetic acid degradation operon negative regulatory protein|nr:phenylacetic acid degradation operon negative regulatory protein PaaX [Gammaproteobacteria bacterium]